MRLVPGGDTVPPVVNQYLLPHEYQVITVRKARAVLIGPAAALLAGLIAAALISLTIASGSGIAVLVVWALWGVLLLWFAVRYAEWAVNYFVVTSQRMLLISGIVNRQVGMMPLTKVNDMRFERSVWGRLLGYGSFVVETAGEQQVLRSIDFVPYPEQLYLEVVGLIFPSKDEEGDD